MKSLWLLLISAMLFAQGTAFTGGSLEIPLLQMNHIFLISILSVAPSQWQSTGARSEARTVTVNLRLEKVLQGELSISMGASTQVDVKQVRYRGDIVWDNPEYWSYIDLRPGQKYLVFSRSEERDLASMVRQPDQVEEVEGGTAVQDVEFMIEMTRFSLAEQAHRLTVWLKDTKMRHGGHVGEYAGALLLKASAKDSTDLRDFVERGGIDDKLTEEGRHALLVISFQGIRSSHGVTDNDLLRALAQETVRFLLGKEEQAAFPTKAQLDIVENYLSWFLDSPQVRTLLKKDVLNKAQRANAIADLETLEKNEKLSTRNRGILANLREILAQRDL